MKRKRKNARSLLWSIAVLVAIVAVVLVEVVICSLPKRTTGPQPTEVTTESSGEVAPQAEVKVFFAFGDGTIITADEADVGRTSRREGNVEYFGVDEEKLHDYVFGMIEKLRNKHLIYYPQNAYITVKEDSREVQLVKAQKGNYISPDVAYDVALEKLQLGETFVDFGPVSETQPNAEAEAVYDEVSNFFKSNIQYSLRDGSIHPLTYQTKKEWLEVDESGVVRNLDIQNVLDEKCKDFLNSLQEEVQDLSREFDFITSTGECIKLSAEQTDCIDIEEETEKFKDALLSGESISRMPTYSKFIDFDDYLEVDLEAQVVKMVIDRVTILEAPCVTGTYNRYDTPTGIFFLDGKQQERYLTGTNSDGTHYKSYVHYWLPFKGDYGLHDATWRSSFGGTIYKEDGSHGCINLPVDAAEGIYRSLNYGHPIVIH